MIENFVLKDSDNEIKKIESLKLIKVDYKIESHNKYLYTLLSKKIHNISHKKMPSFKSHKEFVKNNPYRNWFLISIGSNIIGSIYVLYDNGIGLNLEEKNYGLVTKIIKKLTSRIKPLKSKPSLRNNKFL